MWLCSYHTCHRHLILNIMLWMQNIFWDICSTFHKDWRIYKPLHCTFVLSFTLHYKGTKEKTQNRLQKASMYFLAYNGTLNNVSCSVLTYYISYSEGEPGSKPPVMCYHLASFWQCNKSSLLTANISRKQNKFSLYAGGLSLVGLNL